MEVTTVLRLASELLYAMFPGAHKSCD